MYEERVNAVLDHIETHLADDLDLDTLASIAHFSTFHFHRIFSGLVGETPHAFITRVRLERAATLLVQRPDTSISEIGASCGFGSPSSFTRAFRDTYSVSPSAWRADGRTIRERAKPRPTADDIHEAGFGILAHRIDGATRGSTWTIGAPNVGPADVRIEQVPDLEVAYVRHTGPFEAMGTVFDRIFGQLTAWAHPRGLVGADTWIMTVFHDNPELTDDDRLRVSACITVPANTPPAPPVSRMSMTGGTYAVGRFRLGETDYGEAWSAMMAGWLPESGYEPDDLLPFERYLSGDGEDAGGTDVELCLPVRPLGT